MFGRTKPKPLERRREPRREVCQSAHISFNNGMSMMRCMVENISDHGALLVLPSAIFLDPKIQVSLDGKTHLARVVWKSGRKIGVTWRV
jgi:hypothetical protein